MLDPESTCHCKHNGKFHGNTGFTTPAFWTERAFQPKPCFFGINNPAGGGTIIFHHGVQTCPNEAWSKRSLESRSPGSTYFNMDPCWNTFLPSINVKFLLRDGLSVLKPWCRWNLSGQHWSLLNRAAGRCKSPVLPWHPGCRGKNGGWLWRRQGSTCQIRM